MADIKITQFPSLVSFNSNIVFPVVDVNDTTMSPTGTNKQLAFSIFESYFTNLFNNPIGIGGGVPNYGKFTILEANNLIATEVNTDIIRGNSYVFPPQDDAPAVDVNGVIFYNNNTSALEAYVNNQWYRLTSDSYTISATTASTIFSAPTGSYYNGNTVKYHIIADIDTTIMIDSSIKQPLNNSYFNSNTAVLSADHNAIAHLESQDNTWYLTKFEIFN